MMLYTRLAIFSIEVWFIGGFCQIKQSNRVSYCAKLEKPRLPHLHTAHAPTKSCEEVQPGKITETVLENHRCVLRLNWILFLV